MPVSAHGEALPNEGIALMWRWVDQSETEEGHEMTKYKMNWFLGRSTWYSQRERGASSLQRNVVLRQRLVVLYVTGS